jgi:LPS-assembly lipoprotein
MPMWRSKEIGVSRQLVRLAVVLALGGLTGACFQPLYSSQSIEIANIPAANGRPESRLAVALRNALMYDFNGGGGPNAPTHRLNVNLGLGRMTVIVDVTSGRPDAQIEVVNASFTLTEIATQKVVLNASTFARASFDIPGSAQRFAQQRAARNADDRAVEVLAQNIRNRLASFFVAGT